MNFKRYHVSKNLFDESTLQNGYYGGSDYDYASYRPDDKYRAFAMNLVAGTYTLRIYCDVSIKLLRVSNSIDGRVSVVTDDQPYTFTLAGDATIYVSFRNQTTTNNFPNLKVMLNTGSQPLPYEPYSSEVWHNIPHYVHKTATDTITTLPAVLYPNDTTATVGLKGNMEQSGTPSPTTPIQPQGTGERTGNLFDKNTITPNEFVTIGGESSSTNYYCSDYIPVSEGAYYLANVVGSSYQQGYVVYDSNKQAIRQGTISGAKKVSGVIDISANEYYIRINVRIETSPDVVMVNLGSTALPYEPYGIKIPISSASTTTPVYLGEVESTRNIKEVVFKGSENWTLVSGTHGFYTQIGNALDKGAAYIISSHYRASTDSTDGSMRISNNKREVLLFDNYASVAEYKAYLAQQYAAGTPITIWYVLATPTTGIVNEPIRKIGDYADTVSGITIPTIAGANTISVDTTLQPSEVTVNYKGWHPVQSVHERENGAWT